MNNSFKKILFPHYTFYRYQNKYLIYLYYKHQINILALAKIKTEN